MRERERARREGHPRAAYTFARRERDRSRTHSRRGRAATLRLVHLRRLIDWVGDLGRSVARRGARAVRRGARECTCSHPPVHASDPRESDVSDLGRQTAHNNYFLIMNVYGHRVRLARRAAPRPAAALPRRHSRGARAAARDPSAGRRPFSMPSPGPSPRHHIHPRMRPPAPLVARPTTATRARTMMSPRGNGKEPAAGVVGGVAAAADPGGALEQRRAAQLALEDALVAVAGRRAGDAGRAPVGRLVHDAEPAARRRRPEPGRRRR